MITHCEDLIATPINLGSNELISVDDLVTIAEEIGGVKLRRDYNPDAPKGVAGRNSDNTMIQRILHWQPSTSFRDGLAKTYAWIEQQYLDRKAGKRTHLVSTYHGQCRPTRDSLSHGLCRRLDRSAFRFAAQSPAARLDGRGGPCSRRCASWTAPAWRPARGKWRKDSGRTACPSRDPAALVRELYAEENRGKAEPSGSQDMIGLIYPGVNRLDYHFDHEGGFFPQHIESNNDPAIARWLEAVIHMVPVAPRPDGYNPAGRQEPRPALDRALGTDGQGLLRCDSGPGREGPGGFDERVHDVLGDHPAAHGPPPHDCSRSVGHPRAGTRRNTRGPCIPAAAADTCMWCPKRPWPTALRVTVRIAGNDSP